MTLRAVQVRESYRTGSHDLVKEFYEPCLRNSVLYQRGSGYFNSRVLSMAARGVKEFIRNGGRMQLVCSVQLDEDDQEVLRDPEAYLRQRTQEVVDELQSDQLDDLERRRFGILAYMLANDQLEIRVGIMPRSHAIYHEKIGIFTDAEDNQVTFKGSTNETPAGWNRNFESFDAFISWTTEGRSESGRVNQAVEDFNSLWRNKQPGVKVIPLPEALKQSLVEFKKDYDPDWEEPRDPAVATPEARPMWQWTPGLAFSVEANNLWNKHLFAFGATRIKPYEHQDYVASSVLKSRTPRCLLADEVGLGKTIEAGLILNGLMASGRVKRCMIAVPANAMRQWQSELKTKFDINAWRLDGKRVYPYTEDKALEAKLGEPAHPSNPYLSKDILIVSTYKLRDSDSLQDALDLEYDLIIVDEAHHARARDSQGKRTGNLLLEALQQLRYRTQGLMLLTATPIQLDRRELWDLLELLELPTKWQDEDKFNTFFDQLDEADNKHPDWAFLFDMAGASLQQWAWNADQEQQVKDAFPGVRLELLKSTIRNAETGTVSGLSENDRKALRMLLYLISPVHQMVYRNSRQLLKKYYDEGKYDTRIADREIHQQSIPLDGSPEDPRSEAGIYRRIETYVKEYYAKYEAKRSGAGFVLPFYQKRLTSSFYAVTESLRRRKATLQLAISTGDADLLVKQPEGEQDDDGEFLEESLHRKKGARGSDESILEIARQEVVYLEVLLSSLDGLGGIDSKADGFQEQLGALLTQKHTQAIIFSQYSDTVDYLKERFKLQYAGRVGCYTGDGGQYWNKGKWEELTKQDTQKRFTDPASPLDILFCTDAAAESLNLQSCALLFNYDLPWNPMKIEQRIGRIDRIGQKAPKIDVFVLTYAGTIEDRVVQRCLERIRFFTSTLGTLQPILKQVSRGVLEGCVGSPDEAVEEAWRTAQKVEEARNEFFVNQYSPSFTRLARQAPVTQEEFAAALAPVLAATGWDEERGIWVKGAVRVALDPIHGSDAQVLTPTDPFENLTGALGEPPGKIETGEGPLLHLKLPGDHVRIVFAIENEGQFYAVERLGQLQTGRLGKPRKSPDGVLDLIRNEIGRQETERVSEELILWKQRRDAWYTQTRTYLEAVANYVCRRNSVQSNLPRKATMESEWKAYLVGAGHDLLRALADRTAFRPDYEALASVRGRAPGKSPRRDAGERDRVDRLKDIEDRIVRLEVLARAR